MPFPEIQYDHAPNHAIAPSVFAMASTINIRKETS
jgi:hypothetical protein